MDALAWRQWALGQEPRGPRSAGAAGGPPKVQTPPLAEDAVPPLAGDLPGQAEPAGPDEAPNAPTRRARVTAVAPATSARAAAQRRWVRSLAAAMTVGTVSGLAAVALVSWWLHATGPTQEAPHQGPATSAEAKSTPGHR